MSAKDWEFKFTDENGIVHVFGWNDIFGYDEGEPNEVLDKINSVNIKDVVIVNKSKQGYSDKCIKTAEDRTYTISDLETIFKEIMDRQRYNSRWIFEDGSEKSTDVGWAIEGIEFFLEELKRRNSIQ